MLRVVTIVAILAFTSFAIAQDNFAPAAHYATLFDGGHTFMYTHTSSSAFWDDEDPAADESGMVRSSETATVTCMTTVVLHTAQAAVANFECDGNGGHMEGVWVADATGLWHLREEPAAEADIAGLRVTETPQIAAEPVTFSNEEESDEGHSSSNSVDNNGSTWCAHESHSGGDEAGRSVCFTPGQGISSASDWWSGGSDMNNDWALQVEGGAGSAEPESAPTPEPTSQPAE